MTKILFKVFTSQESHVKLPAHEDALYKTGFIPSPDYKTVWLSIDTAVTVQCVGNT